MTDPTDALRELLACTGGRPIRPSRRDADRRRRFTIHFGHPGHHATMPHHDTSTHGSALVTYAASGYSAIGGLIAQIPPPPPLNHWWPGSVDDLVKWSLVISCGIGVANFAKDVWRSKKKDR